MDASVFVFSPPSGATRIEAPAIAVTPIASTGAEIQIPAGFLAPSYIPDGYQQVLGTITRTTGGQVTKVDVLLLGPRGLITIREQLVPNLETLQPTNSTPVRLANGVVVFRIEQPGQTTLAWGQGDIAMSIFADSRLLDELIRIAQSLESQP
jgi:hypothetical protein